MFKNNDSSELIMRSGDDEMKWWIDLPKLTTLTAEGDYSGTFENPRSITLEGTSHHSILTNRHALSHHCYFPSCIWMQKNRSYQECFSFLPLIPRHHSRSPTVPLLSSFFHTRFTINSLQTRHSHFTILYIITQHSSVIPNRGMREDVPFHHFPSTCSIPLLNSTHHITFTH